MTGTGCVRHGLRDALQNGAFLKPQIEDTSEFSVHFNYQHDYKRSKSHQQKRLSALQSRKILVKHNHHGIIDL